MKKEVSMDRVEQVKQNIKFVRENITLISLLILSVLLLLDYFIFKDVFNLSQAHFFNNLLTIVATEQPLFIIFIFFPLLLIFSIIVFIYKFQYDYLIKTYDKYYKSAYRNAQSINNIVLKSIFFIIILSFIVYGDLLVYFLINSIYELLEAISIKMSPMAVGFTLYFFYVVYNVIVFYFLLVIASFFIIKFKNKLMLVQIIGFIFGLKIGLFPLYKIIPILKDFELKSFALFIALNYLFFLFMSIYVVQKKIVEEKKAEEEKIKENQEQSTNQEKNGKNNYNFIFSVIFIIVFINVYFYVLERLYTEPYIKITFWDKLPTNDLPIKSPSLLLNPAKFVRSEKIEIDLKDLEKKANKKLNLKYKDKKIALKDDIEYFYIPFKNDRLLFIKDKNSKFILTAYTTFKDDKLNKVLDVGFIELK